MNEATVSLRQKCAQLFDMPEMTNDPMTVCGDGSPSYTLGGLVVASRIRLVSPNARFLVILRDPVKRCMAHYNMMQDKNDRHLKGRSFAEVVREDMAALESVGAGPANALEMDDDMFEQDYLRTLPYGHGVHSFVGQGLYAALLRIWFKLVGREHILVLRLEDMVQNTQDMMDKVFLHLGMEPFQLTVTTPKNTQASGYVVDYTDPENEKVLTELKAFYYLHEKALEKLLLES
jgi:hypothetical protein